MDTTTAAAHELAIAARIGRLGAAVLHRFISAALAVIVSVACPSVGDARVGAGAHEVAGGAGGLGTVGLVASVAAVVFLVAVPSQRYALAVAAGEFVGATRQVLTILLIGSVGTVGIVIASPCWGNARISKATAKLIRSAGFLSCKQQEENKMFWLPILNLEQSQHSIKVRTLYRIALNYNIG